MTTATDASRRASRWPLPWLGAFLVLAAVQAAALFAWQRNGYWEFSDGVYADTAQALLHGAHLYTGLAGAQPPPVYLVGALLLGIHDTVASLRVGLGLVTVVTTGLVASGVWRLTGRSRLAVLAGLAAPLLPIALHEHAQLVPETLAAPLILAAATLCADERRAGAGGALLACAVACKLAFVLPAVPIIACSRARRSAGLGFVLALLAAVAATLIAYGSSVVDEVIVAQLQVGAASLHEVTGVAAQAVWNEWPLVLLAALTVRGRDLTDPALRRTLTAAALGGVALGLTLLKRGSAIDVMVVAEPPLLVLAAAGLSSAWSHRRARPVLGLVVAVLALQSASLLLDPGAPALARRPLAASGLEYRMSPGAVGAAVRRARACPPGRAYSGDPYLALLAGRRMPGGQPDLFIISQAAVNARFARRAATDRPVCP